jgi:hypothetical protein
MTCTITSTIWGQKLSSIADKDTEENSEEVRIRLLIDKIEISSKIVRLTLGAFRYGLYKVEFPHARQFLPFTETTLVELDLVRLPGFTLGEDSQ